MAAAGGDGAGGGGGGETRRAGARPAPSRAVNCRGGLRLCLCPSISSPSGSSSSAHPIPPLLSPRLLPPPRPTARPDHDCAQPGVLRRCDVPTHLGLLPLGLQPSAPERVSKNPTVSLSWLHHHGGCRGAAGLTVPYSRAQPAARARWARSHLCLWAGTQLRGTAGPGAAGTRWWGQPAPRPHNLLESQLLATELPCRGYSRVREASELLAL